MQPVPINKATFSSIPSLTLTSYEWKRTVHLINYFNWNIYMSQIYMFTMYIYQLIYNDLPHFNDVSARKMSGEWVNYAVFQIQSKSAPRG